MQKRNIKLPFMIYKICGWFFIVIGIVLSVMGLVSITVGGIVFFIISALLIFLGIAFIKRPKQLIKEKEQLEQRQKEQLEQQQKENRELLQWQKVILHDKSNKIIMTRKQLASATKQRADNDLRIIKDCTKIIQETTKPETFFSRYDLLVEKAKDLVEISPYTKLTGADPNEAYNQIINQKQIAISMFSKKYIEETIKKVNSLKTEKGKNNNYQKAYDNISLYFDQMDDSNIAYIKENLKY